MEYILNLIFSCIFQRDYNRNLEKKVNYDKTKDARHPARSPVNDI